MWDQILYQLSPSQLLVAAAQGLVLYGLGRAVMYALQKKPARETIFFFASFALVLILLTIFRAAFEPVPIFISKIDDVTTGEFQVAPWTNQNQFQKFTFAGLVVSLGNIGAPSAINGYRLTAYFSSGSKKKEIYSDTKRK